MLLLLLLVCTVPLHLSGSDREQDNVCRLKVALSVQRPDADGSRCFVFDATEYIQFLRSKRQGPYEGRSAVPEKFIYLFHADATLDQYLGFVTMETNERTTDLPIPNYPTKFYCRYLNHQQN
mmetsp:Transcript_36724/g.88778  ORF Transcript_36724/g.88778 Transcript_36724/m.88778 type:complete len:122 (-) Transcript_36724:713-1078(-)